jgi:hypothetical protein
LLRVNRARIAALLRELADELEAPDEATAPREQPAPSRQRRAPLKGPPAIARPPSDLDRQRAKEDLRRLGFVVKK